MSSPEKEEKKLKSEKSAKRHTKENPDQVKRIEAELEEESSSEEEGTAKVTRVGYVEMKIKKKEWSAVYCVVIGGSFYFYKNSTDTEPKGSIQLADHQVVSPANETKKKYTFSIKKKKEMIIHYLLGLVLERLN